MSDPSRLSGQTLFIDADDTLWENNIYFERAIANFISFLEHKEMTPEQVREVLFDVERQNVVKHGYGIASFAQALVDTFERISVEPITPALHDTIRGFARTIAEQPIEFIHGVEDTLAYLHGRHRLIMVTKGNFDEQHGKVSRSGVSKFFDRVEIVKEKHPEAYADICERHQVDRATAWMIGNSPKSDINPALEAGMNAVFIPHADTWQLERCELASVTPPRVLLVIERFGDLQSRF